MAVSSRAKTGARVAGAGVVATGLLLASALSSRVVPFNMDEFAAYHPLGCHAYPFSSRLHQYREGCHMYDLRLPFTERYLPLRAYRYIGSLPVLPYYPFWRLAPHPISARLQGAVLFLVAVALTRRVAGVPGWQAVLAASIFPMYFFAFLVDTGPSGLCVLLLLVALLAVQGAHSGSDALTRLAWASAAGLVVFLGAWVKPVFLWTLPGLALAWFLPLDAPATTAAADRRLPGRERLLLPLAAGTALLLPALVLGSSVDRWGERYGQVMRVGRVTLTPDSLATVTGRLSVFFLDASAILPRTITVPDSPLDAVPPLVAVGLLGAAAWLVPTVRLRLIAGLGASVAVFAMTVTAERAWAPHHVVFSMVFLLLSLAVAVNALARVQPRTLWPAAILLGACWLSLAVRLPRAQAQPDANAAKDELLDLVRRDGLDAATVQVHVSWGSYYIAHLFGAPSQAVVYLDRFSARPETFRRLKRAARESGRTILVIGSDHEPALTTAEMERLGSFRREYRIGNWWARDYQP